MAKRYSQIHVVGIGGTGVNIINTILSDPKLLSKLDERTSAYFALDIADGDINELRKTYQKVMSEMKEKGIPLDKLYLRAQTIKFNTPDVLFDFMVKYPEYLAKDGIRAHGYKNWISTSIRIPALAGGVGRQRGLAKATYALNYYHFNEINNFMFEFKDRVMVSGRAPIVSVIFGLGGGTGSGIVFDFSRDLRRKTGNSVPIIGITVMPSTADDSLAKGISSYMALNELRLLFNLELNNKVVREFGEYYRNPFSILFFFPLHVAVVSSKEGTILDARKQVDQAIADIIDVFSMFDVADLLSSIGTNNNFGDNFIHSINLIKVKFPVSEYIDILENELKRMELFSRLVEEKAKILDSINKLIETFFIPKLINDYKLYLAQIGENIENIESNIMSLINRGGKYETELMRSLSGLEAFFKESLSPYIKVIDSIKVTNGSGENYFLSELRKMLREITEISKNYNQDKSYSTIKTNLSAALSSSKGFSAREISFFNWGMNFLDLVDSAIKVVRNLTKFKILAEELILILARLNPEASKRAKEMFEKDYPAISRLSSIILDKPSVEKTLIDQVILPVQGLIQRIEADERILQQRVEQLEISLSEEKNRKDRLEKEYRSIKIDLTGRRGKLRKLIDESESSISRIQSEVLEVNSDLESLKSLRKGLSSVLDMLDITKDYRRILNDIEKIEKEINSKRSEIRPSVYYEKIVDLSEEELSKIMSVLLKGDRLALLDRDKIKDIIDLKKLKEGLKSIMRSFNSPSFFGLTEAYRSDIIWAIVSTSTTWDKEMDEELRSVLSRYASIEANNAITVKPIDSENPWNLIFVVILAKARPEHLEIYNMIKVNSEYVTSKEDRVLFRSYLLEQGVDDIDEFIKQVNR